MYEIDLDDELGVVEYHDDSVEVMDESDGLLEVD